MKEVKISMPVRTLLDEVRRRAEYIGKSLQQQGKDTTAYDRVRATTADAPQLAASVKNALSALKTNLQEWVKDTTSTVSEAGDLGKTLVITMEMPDNWDAHMSDAVEQEAREYTVLTALGDWLGVTDKDDAGGVIQGAAEHLQLLGEAVNKRLRPTMAHIMAMYDSTGGGSSEPATQEALDALAGRVTTNEGNIATLDTRVEKLEAGSAGGDVTALTARMTTAEGNIGTLQTDVGEINSSLDGLTETINGLIEDVDTAKANGETAITRLDGHDKAINANKEAAATNATDIATINGKVGTLQTDLAAAKEQASNKQLKMIIVTADEGGVQLDMRAADLSALAKVQIAGAVAGDSAGVMTAEQAKLLYDTSIGLDELKTKQSDDKAALLELVVENSEAIGTYSDANDELTKRVDALEASGGTGGSTDAKETVTGIASKEAKMWPVSNETTIYVNKDTGTTILLPMDAEFAGRRIRIIAEGGGAVKVAPGRAYRYHLYYMQDGETLCTNGDDEVAGAIKAPAVGTRAATLGACSMMSGATAEEAYGVQIGTGAVELVAVPCGVHRMAVPTGKSVVRESVGVKDKYSIKVYTGNYGKTVDDRTGATTGCITVEDTEDAVTDVSTLGLVDTELVRWALVTARGDVKALNKALTTTGALV